MENPVLQPEVQPAPAAGNGIGVAGFVTGLLSCVLFFLWPLSVILGILGIIFGAVGRGKAKRGAKGLGLSTAGLILGVVGLALMVLFIVVLAGVFMTASHHHY
jgi:hypothetical protein